MNDFASKFDTPLLTFGFRIAATLLAMAAAIVAYAGRQLINDVVAKTPVVYNVGTRIDENTKRTIELSAHADDTLKRVETNERAVASMSATQTKIQEFLRKSLENQQEISVKLGTLAQKVDDGQLRAQDAEKRLDARLDRIR